jgi:hypothetical protein
MPPWVFANTEGKPLDISRVRKAFTRTLKASRLPLHFSPHCLRHTFASLLLQVGHSPAYVQRQLGHASIQLTVDTYGRWLPLGNKAAVDGLDDESGSKTVREVPIELFTRCCFVRDPRARFPGLYAAQAERPLDTLDLAALPSACPTRPLTRVEMINRRAFRYGFVGSPPHASHLPSAAREGLAYIGRTRRPGSWRRVRQ